VTGGGEADLVAEGSGAEVDWRGAYAWGCGWDCRCGWDREVVEGAYDAVALVFDGGDDAVGVAGEIPPLIGADTVAIGVGTGAYSGVAGSGFGVGVVVIAGGEVGSALEEEIEAIGSLEGVAIAIEVVAPELVDDEENDEFGLGVISLGVGGRRSSGQHKEQRQEGNGTLSHHRKIKEMCCRIVAEYGG